MTSLARAVRAADGSGDVETIVETCHFGALGRSEVRRQAVLVALRLLLP